MNARDKHAGNLLGASALFVTGIIREAVTGAVGSGGALGEALIAIKDQPGRTADWLGGVLRISQPGTAHLVRRLTEQGWLERSSRGRARPLWLTPEGERVAAAALSARQGALQRLIERLTDEQREHLVPIAAALLGPEARSERLVATLCRLCDRASCPQCPVYEEWRQAARSDMS
ncbi:winged helix-turn-helix transcriptional regulator [Nonomuraea turkmeniaca]|uniref:Winged helix-turn-helix transcriptional regulator n=1 Tax=Nonomuraea turkmeniaca TaxID=103838 RepID=A0A5S4F608_9ACTN|nr:MarR family winged helix-turn-helix transcriptional regulator [Nonomuraea turkmeniaca]TMR11428.1 winged helix-turn-helix transcriptional regulator [Nonomuraea turkmeniaca]